jgi:hypothetical protein
MKRILAVFSGLILGAALSVAVAQVKDDLKDAGHNTKEAAKDAGKATATGTKKAAKDVKKGAKKTTHAAASETEKGADKVKEKTQ